MSFEPYVDAKGFYVDEKEYKRRERWQSQFTPEERAARAARLNELEGIIHRGRAGLAGRNRQGTKKSDKSPTDLYRCFAADGALLYVGISLRIAERMGQHRSGSGWWRQVVRIHREQHPNRAAALAAEARAIATEGPIHNA